MKHLLNRIQMVAPVLFVLFSAVAHAESTYEYRIKRFAGTPEACSVEAKAVAQRLSGASGVKISFADCERPQTSEQDLVVRYRSETEIYFVSTASEYGSYKTKEACEQGIEAEKKIFSVKTNVPIISAACVPAFFYSKVFPFASRIDGYGVASLKPQVFHGYFYTNPVSSREILEDTLLRSLQHTAVIDSPSVRIDTSLTSQAVTVKYYSTEQQALTLTEFVSFESLKTCLAQQANLDATFKKMGVWGATSFCGREAYSQIVNFYTFGLLTKPFQVKDMASAYPTRAECEASLAQLIGSYEDSQVKDGVTGLCSFKKMDVLSNPGFYATLFIEQ